MREDDEGADLAARVAEFRSDPEKLEQVARFVDELLQLAQKDAERKRKENDITVAEDTKRPSVENGSMGGKRRLGSRARGMMVRLFDVLCHCSQQAAAAARTHTQSLRASRR